MSILGFLGSAIPGVMNAVGNGIASYQNLKAVRETNEANFKLAQWQNQANIDMWNMNNAYNTPSAQMERLKEAGLNPNLVYGNGSVGNSSSAPSGPSLPTMQAYQMPQNIMGDLSSVMDQVLKLAQVKKVEQETNNLAQYNKLTKFQTDKMELEVAMQGFLNAKTETEAKYWKDKIEMEIGLAQSQVDLNYAKHSDTYSQQSFRENVQKPYVLAQTKKIGEETLSTIAERSLIGYRRAALQASVEASLANAAATMEGIQLTHKQISKISAEIMNIGADYDGKQLENKIKSILVNNGLNIKQGGIPGLINQFGWFLQNVVPW